MKNTHLLIKKYWQKNQGIAAGYELVKRGKARIIDRKRHLYWEWIAFELL